MNNVVSGDVVTLTKYYPGLKTGKSVILTGERADLPGTNASEIRSLKEILIANGITVLVFDTPLDYTYVRKKLTINANVAAATHGETVKEVLGSGNAASSFQQFVLKQPPLTYISSSSANGTKSTLEIRVNNILWEEVPSFFERGPAEHIYITRQDDQANTTVIFGDGKNGSRLPTGRENIKATYRKGIGSGGLLKANQLSQLMTRPLGVKAATNPLITSGAEDGEVLADARSNATLTIFTLGRIVSLQDYEDFARAFAGISKALATWTWTGQKRSVYLTVAGTAGATVEQDLYKKLVSAIQQAGIPGVPVTVVSYQARFFRLVANIQVDPAYLPDLVLPAVEKELRGHFSFSNRSFGQPVALSEVFSVIQNVEGVTAVDIDKLYRSDEAVTLQDRLDAEVPRPGNETADPAEILIIDSRPVDLKIML
jgi:predicted phage baseplate assembly protein